MGSICSVAAFTPGSTFISVGQIITEMTEASEGGIYGSTYYGDTFYNISKTEAELTLSGRRD